ncbi:MAG: PAS domain S-box protein [Magnetococcales bacterium]|nr:PAS domain S-box protein [Magnetococcales bacterium]
MLEHSKPTVMLQHASKRDLAKLVVMVAGVALIVTLLAIGFLYNAAFEQIGNQLVTLTRSEVALLRSLNALEDTYSVLNKENRIREILQEVVAAHQETPWPLLTQELAIGHKNAEGFTELLLRMRHDEVLAPLVLPQDQRMGSPMHLAMKGESGTIIGHDYRGEMVLAGYEYVPELGLGVVAKIDLAEIRRPFLVASAFTFLLAFCVTAMGGLHIIRITRPIIWQLAREKERRRHAETLYRVLFENMADGIVVINGKGLITHFNTMAERIFGWTEKEVSDQSVSMLLPLAQRESYEDHLAEQLEVHRTQVVDLKRELHAMRKDGAEIMIEIRVREFYLGGDKHYIAVVRDVAEERETRERIERLNRELLEAERGSSMAAIANGVLHNVGNLLVPVVVGVQILVEGLRGSRLSRLVDVAKMLDRPEDEQIRFLTTDAQGRKVLGYLGRLSAHLVEERANLLNEANLVVAGSDAVSKLISSQQALARRSSGEMESVNIAEIIDQLLAMNAYSFERHFITVERDFNASIVELVLDRQRLLQIVANLIWNARDALKSRNDGRAVLSIQLRSDPHHVWIIVSDNGCGIAAENLPHLFKEGFTTKSGGHGFGLYSAACSARELGGGLTVSCPGIGSGATFTLQLPVRREEHEDEYGKNHRH